MLLKKLHHWFEQQGVLGVKRFGRYDWKRGYWVVKNKVYRRSWWSWSLKNHLKWWYFRFCLTCEYNLRNWV